MLPNIYRRVVLQHPYVVLTILLLILAYFALQVRHFALDASADSLLLEDDKDLQIFRQAANRYDSQDLLLLTYEPDAELFTDESLTTLGLPHTRKQIWRRCVRRCWTVRCSAA